MNDVLLSLFSATLLAMLLASIGAYVVCGLKGKPWLIVLSILLPFPFMWVGAVRLAKPHSRWARRNYGPEKMARAEARFYGSSSEPELKPLKPQFTGSSG